MDFVANLTRFPVVNEFRMWVTFGKVITKIKVARFMAHGVQLHQRKVRRHEQHNFNHQHRRENNCNDHAHYLNCSPL